MNVFFNINEKKDPGFSIALEIIAKLLSYGFNVYTDSLDLVNENVKLVNQDNLNSLDFAMIVGGDGTVLNFMRKYQDLDLALYVINLGRVGALADVELAEYENSLQDLKNGHYSITQYAALNGVIYREKEAIAFTAYNDICLYRGLSPKLLNISVSLNNGVKDILRSDGAIIASAAGSSAYNLSAGGPLLMPQTNSFVMTPVCAQFKLFSPIVISNDSILTFKVENSEGTVLTVDGALEYSINKEDIIEITGSEKHLKLISVKDERDLFGSFYKIAKSVYRR